MSLDKKIMELFQLRGKVGEFGLELEVEGANLPIGTDFLAFWQYHADGSLRGESGEYVLSNPLNYAKLEGALDHLSNVFKKCKSTFKLSRRTSVHVHLNVQKMRVQELYNLICLYFLFEDLMTHYAGPDRVGNLFCLRARDAEGLPLKIASDLRKKRYLNDFGENLRYAAMNLNAIPRYGSVEFRAFRGSVDIQEIKNWVQVIHNLKSWAFRYKDPYDVVSDFLDIGTDTFLKKIMPDHFVTTVTGYKNWHKHMDNGFIYAHEIAVATPWIDLTKIPVKEDFLVAKLPFEPDWFEEEYTVWCTSNGYLVTKEWNDRDWAVVVGQVHMAHEARERNAIAARAAAIRPPPQNIIANRRPNIDGIPGLQFFGLELFARNTRRVNYEGRSAPVEPMINQFMHLPNAADHWRVSHADWRRASDQWENNE